MKNRTLEEIMSYSNDIMELQTYFYQLSLDMKKLHQNGIYVTDFKPSNIHYNDGGFSFLAENIEDNKEVVISNIYDFGMLMLETYSSKGGIKEGINKDNVKSLLPMIEYLIPENDVAYFRGLFSDNQVSYYHDYEINMKESLGGGKYEHKNYVKATAIGAMLTDTEDSLNKSAYISVPAVFVMAGMLIIIMILIYTFFFVLS